MAASKSTVSNLAHSVATISQMINNVYLNTDINVSTITAPINSGITITSSKNYDIDLKTSGIGNVNIGEMSLSNSTISSISGITLQATTDNDITLSTSGTGNINLENFTIQDNTIQNENESYIIIKNNNLNLITDTGYKTYITNISSNNISGTSFNTNKLSISGANITTTADDIYITAPSTKNIHLETSDGGATLINKAEFGEQTFTSITVGNISISGDAISNSTNDMTLSTISGKKVIMTSSKLGNLEISEDTISNSTNSKILLDSYVGIGVSSPTQKLEINGGIVLGDTTITKKGSLRYKNYLETYDGSNWRVTNIAKLINNPTGIHDLTKTTMAFDKNTHVFSLTPIEPQFKFYYLGIEFIKTSASITIDPITANELYYIYFDSNGDMQYGVTPWVCY